MSKFTAGKWTYDTPSGCVHCEGKLIADVAGAGGANYQHDKGQANARLIAHAPEMYKLLVTILNDTQDGHKNELIALLNAIDGQDIKDTKEE